MITPLLEKYILSGQAVFKNTSIGENGLLALEIPRGSTAIITKIICEPFLNLWQNPDVAPTGDYNNYLVNLLRDATNMVDLNNELLARCEYNLKVYSESGKVKINYNLRQEIEVNYLEKRNINNVDHFYFPALKPKYAVRELDCFILANETIFFMYTFPTFNRTVTGVTAFVDDFGISFNNTTPVPLTPNGPSPITPEMRLYALGGTSAEAYVPMGTSNTVSFVSSPLPLTNEIYRGEDPTSEMRLPTPTATIDQIDQNQNYSLPLLNIEYVLINSGLGSLFNPGDEGI
jgi:hypothetical protein